MSKFVSSLIGIAALVGSLGVAQLAVGDSLTGSIAAGAATQSNLVNRSAKSDRPAGIKPLTGNTVVSRLGQTDDTSVALRMPLQVRRDSTASGKNTRRPVACEAPASVLSEIAQQLESGRCVT